MFILDYIRRIVRLVTYVDVITFSCRVVAGNSSSRPVRYVYAGPVDQQRVEEHRVPWVHLQVHPFHRFFGQVLRKGNERAWNILFKWITLNFVPGYRGRICSRFRASILQDSRACINGPPYVYQVPRRGNRYRVCRVPWRSTKPPLCRLVGWGSSTNPGEGGA